MSVTPVVIFDIIGTLFPLTPAGDFIRILLTRELTTVGTSLDYLPSVDTLTSLLYAELIKEAACLSYAQYYTPLPQLAPLILQRIVNRYLCQHGPQRHTFALSADERSQLSTVLTTLPARSGAKELLSTLAQYARLIALSNGALSSTQSLLSHSSLSSFFSSVLSADTARATKPDPKVYALVTPHVVQAAHVFFVSQHSFDIHGVLRWNALRRGEQGSSWRTVWVSQEERVWLDVGAGEGDAAASPDFTVADLSHVADCIGQSVAKLKTGEQD